LALPLLGVLSPLLGLEVLSWVIEQLNFLGLRRPIRGQILLIFSFLGHILDGRLLRLLGLQDLFKVHQLPLEAHIRKDDVSSLADVAHAV